MSRKVPAYRRHPNGQAYIRTVRLNDGKPIYLGKYGTLASRRRYQEIIDLLLKNESTGEPIAHWQNDADQSIGYLVDRYTDFTERSATKKEHSEILYSVRPLCGLFSTMPCEQFKPKHLVELQEKMIVLGWCRNTINHRIGRIKRMFRWGGKHDLVPAELYWKLKCVEGLKYGELGARETSSVKPVPLHVVESTLPWLAPLPAVMVRLHLLCGMRSQDVCGMRPMDINMEQEIWVYRPPKHKLAYLGKERRIAIPKTAQAILVPAMEGVAPDQYVFSPRRSEQLRRSIKAAATNQNRKTPIYPSELKRRAKLKAARQRSNSQALRDFYDPHSYRQAIDHAIEKAERNQTKIPHWHPHQLRHSLVTAVSRAFSEQHAQVYVGHEQLDTTAIYAERQLDELIEIAQQLDAHWKSGPEKWPAALTSLSNRL